MKNFKRTLLLAISIVSLQSLTYATTQQEFTQAYQKAYAKTALPAQQAENKQNLVRIYQGLSATDKAAVNKFLTTRGKSIAQINGAELSEGGDAASVAGSEPHSVTTTTRSANIAPGRAPQLTEKETVEPGTGAGAETSAERDARMRELRHKLQPGVAKFTEQNLPGATEYQGATGAKPNVAITPEARERIMRRRRALLQKESVGGNILAESTKDKQRLDVLSKKADKTEIETLEHEYLTKLVDLRAKRRMLTEAKALVRKQTESTQTEVKKGLDENKAAAARLEEEVDKLQTEVLATGTEYDAALKSDISAEEADSGEAARTAVYSGGASAGAAGDVKTRGESASAAVDLAN